MDFYSHQERARRHTLLFSILFVCGVIGIIAVTYFLLAVVNAMAVNGERFTNNDLWNPTVLVFSIIFTLVVVGGSSLYKVSQLKKGGGAFVAEQVGGRRISPDTEEFRERKVLNVVEEIAIAAGVPTPAVYLLEEEEGINAFAAGYSVGTAVIGITAGAVEILTREELQGVIAHEFSHICNGDMRINIRMMGVLFGILALGVIGYYTLRSSFYFRSSSKKSAPAQMGIVILGLGMIAIGFVGSFFGNLIKAAISRQREFLADATAVEYTRDPDTIGSALRKIRDNARQGYILSPHAPEMSHMFFSKGVFSTLGSFFATHPPIEERIERVYGVSAEFLEKENPKIKPKEYKKKKKSSTPRMLAASILMASAERPSYDQIERAKKLIDSIPETLRAALREPYGARAVVFGLLLSEDKKVRAKQLSALSKTSKLGVFTEVNRLIPEFDKLDHSCRLPLLDMCLPTLTLLSRGQFEDFKETFEGMILADNSVDLFEWVLEKILIYNVQPHFIRQEKVDGTDELKAHAWDAATLLQTLAYIGHKEEKDFNGSFQDGMKHLGFRTTKAPKVSKEDFSKLDNVVKNLQKLTSEDKRKFLEACLITMSYDKVITVYESELFRAVADVLGVNIPLILPGEL